MGPFCFCFVFLRSYRCHKDNIELPILEDDVRGGALGSLPCSGLLFLLVTRRSPRTGSPTRPKAQGEHWGGKGLRTMSDLTSIVRTLQSREEDDRDFTITYLDPECVQRVAGVWPGGTSAGHTIILLSVHPERHRSGVEGFSSWWCNPPTLYGATAGDPMGSKERVFVFIIC